MNQASTQCAIFLIIVQILAAWAFSYSAPKFIKPRLPDTFKFKPVSVPPPLDEGNDAEPTNNIVGGSLAKPGMIPYQCQLVIDTSYRCGGSLISPIWVLTAAHCAIGRKQFEVTMGNMYSFRGLAPDPYLWKVMSYTKFVHEKYNPSRFYNDIALVKLPTSPPLSAYIKPIDLPKASDAQNSFAGYMGIASGWGWTRDRSVSSDVLAYAKMLIVSNAECNQTYNVYGSNFIVNSTICTSGAGPKSTCRGDSGGPLVVTINNIFYLIGITSFGVTSCESGFPQAYTRVSSHLAWISSKIGIVIDP